MPLLGRAQVTINSKAQFKYLDWFYICTKWHKFYFILFFTCKLVNIYFFLLIFCNVIFTWMCNHWQHFYYIPTTIWLKFVMLLHYFSHLYTRPQNALVCLQMCKIMGVWQILLLFIYFHLGLCLLYILCFMVLYVFKL